MTFNPAWWEYNWPRTTVTDFWSKPKKTFGAEVQDVFEEARELLLSKHRDYGSENIASAPGGALNGLRVRMHDKMARINNLANFDPEHESLRDSLVDMMNYSAIAIMVLDGTWPTE